MSSIATSLTGAGPYGASPAAGISAGRFAIAAGQGGSALSGSALGGSAAGGSLTPAMLVAKQRLAKANAIVDADKAAHSPSCVACDQKLVVQAQLALSQATSAASVGSRLDISA